MKHCLKSFHSAWVVILISFFGFCNVNVVTAQSVVDDKDDVVEDWDQTQPYDFEVDGLYYKFRNQPFNEVEISATPNGYCVIDPYFFPSDWDEPGKRIIKEDGTTNHVISSILDENGILTIPETVAFNGVTYVVTRIANVGFANFPEIKKVILSPYIKSLGIGAFIDCKNLSEIEFEGALTTIGRSAFKDCVSLKRILVPASVTEMGWSVFMGCNSSNINFSSKTHEIPPYMFANNENIKSFMVPEWVTELGENAFRGCKNLNVYLHNRIKKIYDGCFYENGALYEVVIPNSVEYIGYSAFSNCSNLWHFTLSSRKLTLRSNVCDSPYIKLISLLNPDVLQGNCNDAFPMRMENGGRKMVFEVKTAMAQKYLDYYTDYMADYVSVEMKSSGESTTLYVNPCEEENQFDSDYLAKLNKETSLLVNKEQSVVVGWKVNENNISETPYLNGLELTDVTYQDGMALVKLEGLTKNSVFEVKAVNTGVDVVAETAEFEIYSLDGIRLYKGEDTTVKETLPKGIYIVKQNGTSTKICK